jgi:hypothetical protein
MKTRIVVSTVFVCLLTCCNWVDRIVCGEPSGKQKEFIDRINKQYSGKLTIQQVPCYPGYLQVNCSTPITSKELNEIEFEAGHLNWYEILVYDKNNKLIRGNTNSM